MNNVLRIGWLVFAFCVLAFGVFVWPTPYEYRNSPNAQVIYCVERITGKTWALAPGGWEQMGQAPRKPY